jgi:hypothetical protein
MQSDSFLEFLARRGHRIVKTQSCYWYNAQPKFYFYFPYHKLITPNDEELKQLLWGEPCVGVRYFTPMDHFGKESFQIVCTDKNYDFSSVDKHSARRETRRGLENVVIRQMEFKELATLGINLENDTLLRQGRAPQRQEEKKWRQFCLSMDGLEGFEAWGAFADNNLASFLTVYQMEDDCIYLHQGSATQYMPLFPNRALYYYVTRLKITSPDINTIYCGPQSLDGLPSIDAFKFSMGFQKSPMKQAIVFNPVVKPFINGFTHRCFRLVSSLRPQSDTIRKLEGIVRFYREAT